MSFPRYPSYKDSGVAWLGEVPAHWAVCAIKRIASLQSGESITAESIEESGEYPVFGGGGQRGFTSSFTHDGDFVLFGRQGALCGNVSYGRGKFWASEHSVVATPVKPVDTVWLGELLRAMNLNQYSVSAAQPGLSVDAVGRLGTCVPPLDEQRAIAAFLDTETAKVDALVAEQRTLMDLLTEKRQAVISHAVTKGLDPAAPMKASGVAWLGNVPAHWSVKRVKDLAQSIEQGWSPQCESFPAEADTEWGVLKVGCVNGGVLDPQENKLLPAELEPEPSLALRKGDLLVSRANTRELVGSAAVVETDYPKLLLCDKLYRLRFMSGVASPKFLSYYLSSSNARDQIELQATGASSSMVNIAQSAIMDLALASPPIDEQMDIASRLEANLETLEAMSNEVQHAIDLLLERRAALITAAVTGQIDVRGVAAAEAA